MCGAAESCSCSTTEKKRQVRQEKKKKQNKNVKERENKRKRKKRKRQDTMISISMIAVQVSTLEFSRDRKMMSILAQGPNNQDVIFVKGAPESVLESCSHVSPALPCSAHVKALSRVALPHTKTS